MKRLFLDIRIKYYPASDIAVLAFPSRILRDWAAQFLTGRGLNGLTGQTKKHGKRLRFNSLTTAATALGWLIDTTIVTLGTDL